MGPRDLRAETCLLGSHMVASVRFGEGKLNVAVVPGLLVLSYIVGIILPEQSALSG